jgi:hypothetical protein
MQAYSKGIFSKMNYCSKRLLCFLEILEIGLNWFGGVLKKF